MLLRLAGFVNLVKAAASSRISPSHSWLLHLVLSWASVVAGLSTWLFAYDGLYSFHLSFGRLSGIRHCLLLCILPKVLNHVWQLLLVACRFHNKSRSGILDIVTYRRHISACLPLVLFCFVPRPLWRGHWLLRHSCFGFGIKVLCTTISTHTRFILAILITIIFLFFTIFVKQFIMQSEHQVYNMHYLCLIRLDFLLQPREYLFALLG